MKAPLYLTIIHPHTGALSFIPETDIADATLRKQAEVKIQSDFYGTPETIIAMKPEQLQRRTISSLLLGFVFGCVVTFTWLCLM